MDLNQLFSNALISASLLTFIINLPFGYWRQGSRRFSFKWFLYIHLPVPIIVGLRFLFALGFEWVTYPALVLAFFLGQAVGAQYRKMRKKKTR